MWRCRSVRVLRSQRCLFVCGFSSASIGGKPPLAPLKLYVIAGEASGDAIGAKVIRALQRHEPSQSLEFRGIGGPQMCKTGGFKSLFPMQELSVMGLMEVVPYIWRFRRRLRDTFDDIKEYQPELVLTIDSKGFTFRVLKALRASEQKTGSKRIRKAHYVAPSVWAYKHRGKRDFTELSQLLDAMFTILPFEEDIFSAGEKGSSLESWSESESKASWCHFVGHPAVEDFLEVCGVYKGTPNNITMRSKDNSIETGPDALLKLSNFDMRTLMARGQLFQALVASGREAGIRARVRKDFEIPSDALIICALVGSRVNEVKKSSQLVLDAIEQFKKVHGAGKDKELYVVFPTITAVEDHVLALISLSSNVHCRVVTDLNPSERLQLFQSSDLAIAVSGTIVLETSLAGLPTVVIYRANRLTELIAQRLAAVRFVSVPNLLVGRPLLPELLFSECTASNIAEALRHLQRQQIKQSDDLQLAAALSTLNKWQEADSTTGCLKPIRPSDLVAKRIFDLLGRN